MAAGIMRMISIYIYARTLLCVCFFFFAQVANVDVAATVREIRNNMTLASSLDWVQKIGPDMSIGYGCCGCGTYPLSSVGLCYKALNIKGECVSHLTIEDKRSIIDFAATFLNLASYVPTKSQVPLVKAMIQRQVNMQDKLSKM